MNVLPKKYKVSKKKKKSWRKYVNIKDVEHFLDNVRLEERLGIPFSLRKNDELFSVDKNRNFNYVNEKNHLTKQQYRELLNNIEPNCLISLKPSTSSIPYSIKDRNAIKKLNEKENHTLKKIEFKKKLKCKLKLKHSVKKIKNAKNEFYIDIWKEKFVEPELGNGWLTNNTKRHILTNTGKKQKLVPKLFYKKQSILPPIIKPHPGTSYNPSYIDHQELLTQVATDEIKLIKAEEHLNRVTKYMFSKGTLKKNNQDNLKEMSEGLPFYQENNILTDEVSDPNAKSINHTVKNKKKTLIQRRKQKEQRLLQKQQIKHKIEKKKIVDIYHLKNITEEILKKQRKEELLHKKRLQIKAKKEFEPKILSKNKFEIPMQEFQMSNELSGNLRCVKPVGNLLNERYKSFQQRNLVAPGKLVLKQKKVKVKAFIKADHKINIKNSVK